MPSFAQRVISETRAVLAAADRQTRTVLMKFGAFVRRDALQSIRPGKKPAPPGKPPHAHRKSALKRFLRFFYDDSQKLVIIGPEKLPGKIGDAPHALEHSGATKIKTGRKGHRVVRSVTLAARPFMGPAAAKNEPKLPAMWANSVKR